MSLPAYTKKPKTFWEKNFANVFIVVGLTFIGITLAIFINQYLFFTKSIKTTGKVIGFEVPKNRSLAVPIIEYFTPDNVRHEYQHTEGTKPSIYRRGEEIKIYYNPDNPTEISFGYSFIAMGILLFFGVIFLSLGLGFKNKTKTL
ncbi:hypothetical protein GCM10027035_13440 [Emticicia sediminis]